jgi:ribosomal protein L11 methylase PrmA
LADPARRWHALDITLRAAQTSDADIEGHLLAFLDDHAPTAVTAPPGGEEGWLVTASQHATPAWLPGPGDTARAASPRAWRVFFASADARDGAGAALAASEWAARVDLAAVEVEDKGWAERSQAALRAVQVGRLIIAPPWDADGAPRVIADDETLAAGGADASAAGERESDAAAPLVVIIEPSMGFGTGHHQSTRLCLRALQAIDLAGRRVLDLGTGSGVLAIAAAMLGAVAVLALDDDQDAVGAARDNVRLNRMDACVTVQQGDLRAMAPYHADVVLANLTGALLMRHVDAIVRHITPGGLIVLSGFTDDERFAVAHAFRDLRLVRDEREDGWLGLTLTRSQAPPVHE